MVIKVLNTIKKNNMLSPSDKVLVAFSGGADSSVLLDVLVSLSKELEISVCAAHLNHMLRGKDADADEEFARKKCESYGIEFMSEQIDIAELSQKTGQSTELAARNARYDFLSRAKKEMGASKIATAHNANDNLETILFNIARGSGLEGLCGIPPVREDIIRPVIEATRKEIEDYAEARNISFCTDKTNSETVYARNKLRHMALPALSEVNAAAVDNALRMSEILRQDACFLRELSEKKAKETAVSKNVCKRYELSKLPDAIFGRICMIFAKNAAEDDNYVLEHKHIADIRKLCGDDVLPSAKIHLPRGISVRCEYEKLVFEKCEEKEKPTPAELAVGENVYGEYVISVKKMEKASKVNNSVNTFFVLCDKISGSLAVRPREEGDRIKLPKRCGKSLKKLFVDEHIPKNERDRIPVIADDEKVLAVGGFGADEEVLPKIGEECFEIQIKKKQ